MSNNLAKGLEASKKQSLATPAQPTKPAEDVSKAKTVAERNNNPGNLRSWEGYESKDGFAKFPDLKTGWNKLQKQVELDSQPSRKHTAETFIEKFAPKTENDTEAYADFFIKSVQKLMPEATLSTSMADITKKIGKEEVAKIMAKRENEATYKKLKDNNFYADNKTNTTTTTTKSVPIPDVITKADPGVMQQAISFVEKASHEANVSIGKATGAQLIKGIDLLKKKGVDIPEDVTRIADYLKNGGGMSSIIDFAKAGMNKASGGGASEAKEISFTNTSGSIKGTEGLTKFVSNSLKKVNKDVEDRKPLFEGLKTSNTGVEPQSGYSSKSFALNLKSKNNFKVLDNGKDGDVDKEYADFKSVKGDILFTIQNDIEDSSKNPLWKMKGTSEDGWVTVDNDYVVALENNNIVVKKSGDLKKGDDVFKLKRKIFSFDDFDIKDGKIKTKYNKNIGALVPVIKKSNSNTFKRDEDFFTLGLNKKNSNPNSDYLDINEANMYGKSKGGSFIIFSEDLTQQYMIGGSFKNLYDFNTQLEERYPDKKFKVFASDTGTYSNSVFPDNGIIDSDIYKHSNQRNTYGHVQHLVLTR